MSGPSWNRRSNEDAERILSEAGYKPLGEYPGQSIKWPAVHLECGTPCTPRLSKIINGIGQCPKCNLENRRNSPKDNKSFAEKFPEMAAEAYGWDPKDFSYSSGKILGFKCNLGHTWDARLADRAKDGTQCPFCSGRRAWPGFNDLQTTSPVIAREADGWDPSSKVNSSGEKVGWICELGHKWISTIQNRTLNGTGCPYCAPYSEAILLGVNDLASTNSDIAAEADGWDPTKFRTGSSRKMNWKCQLGHQYVSTIAHRTIDKSACPYCAGLKILPGFNDLLTRFPLVASEANGWDPSKVASGSHTAMSWRCSKNHVWKTSPANRNYGGTGCPSCTRYGFDPNEDSFLYFLEHLDWDMLQIGITNSPKTRIQDHQKLGWTVREIRGPMDGHLARSWEKDILDYLRSIGAEVGSSTRAGKFTGFTESWMKSSFHVGSLRELMDIVDESDPK